MDTARKSVRSFYTPSTPLYYFYTIFDPAQCPTSDDDNSRTSDPELSSSRLAGHLLQSSITIDKLSDPGLLYLRGQYPQRHVAPVDAVASMFNAISRTFDAVA